MNLIEPSAKPREFTLSEIQMATKNFDESLVIGRGGFGKVYKGEISHRLAAIKRLNTQTIRATSEFWAEIEMLSTLRHCNIVQLIGYCHHVQEPKMCSTSWPFSLVSSYEEEMLLVYEYVPNGALKDHLHGLHIPLSWMQRLKICLGAARGLEYLHSCTPSKIGVVHGDMKSSNILLDDCLVAKISDFGLVKKSNLSNLSTGVKGTFGYMDPSYIMTGMRTRKSDVYAFGVVMLEVLCGRLAVDERRSPKQRILVTCAQDSRNLEYLIDLNIRNEISSGCLQIFARVAHLCLLESQKERPTMAEVIHSLESALRLQERSNNMLQSAVQGDPSNSTKSPQVAASPSPSVKVFEFACLRKATRDFSPDLLVGKGGFGSVYKGGIDQTREDVLHVAVKRLKQPFLQGHNEFLAEVNLLSRHHPNIVRLLGYCMEEDERLLVYEYMPKKSLDHFLFEDTTKALSWRKRVSILTGVVRGLAYLHSCNLVHHDFKSSSILLDADFNAKVGGLSKYGLEPDAGEKDVKMLVGRRGYIDPDYWTTGRLNVKSDVFGFGVVVLECLTGRRAFDPNPHDGKHSLVEWVSGIQTNRRTVKKIIDPRLEHNYSVQSASKCFALALRCVEKKPMDRPSSEDVLQSLEQITALDK